MPSPPYCGSQPIICNTAWHEVGWDKAVTPNDVWSNRLVVVHGLRPTLQVELFAWLTMWSTWPTVSNPLQQLTYEFFSGLGMEACAAITEYPDTFKACESAYWAYDGWWDGNRVRRHQAPYLLGFDLAWGEWEPPFLHVQARLYELATNWHHLSVKDIFCFGLALRIGRENKHFVSEKLRTGSSFHSSNWFLKAV